MKSFILAASAVTAVAGHNILELGINVNLSPVINLGVGLDLHLPEGLELPANAEDKPTSGPPVGYVNVWHPPHYGVVIDQCSDENDESWHWVHPCGDNCKPEQPAQVWTTSTVSVTSVHTVISCAPTITNCPANGHHTTVTTVVIPETTTICPVEASKTATPSAPAAPSTAAYPPPAASSPAYSAPVPTNTAVLTLSTQTAPAYTPPAASYPVPGNSAPPAYSAPPAASTPAVVPSAPASSPYYPAPAAPSAPVYPVPGNASVPAYIPPSTSVYTPPVQSPPAGVPAYSAPPAIAPIPSGGCGGGAYCPPPAPAPTGNGTTPVPVNDAVGRAQGVSMALFAGVIVALFL